MKKIVYILTKLGVPQEALFWLSAARTAVLGAVCPSFMKGVVLELNTMCNRRCPYCPLAIQQVPNQTMSDDVLDRVIDNLDGFAGTIDVGGFYNEPLAELNILRKALPRIRAAAPNAFVRLYSNADYLTESLAEELFGLGLDYLYVTLHDNSEKRRQKITSWPVAQGGRVRVDLARELVIRNRGGYKVKGAVGGPRTCFMQYAPLIGWDGRVHLCCVDFHKSCTLGDIKTDRLRDIAGRTYGLRLKILFGRLPTPACRQCAYPTLGELPFQGFTDAEGADPAAAR